VIALRYLVIVTAALAILILIGGKA